MKLKVVIVLIGSVVWVSGFLVGRYNVPEPIPQPAKKQSEFLKNDLKNLNTNDGETFWP